jgi:hypothetical protein
MGAVPVWKRAETSHPSSGDSGSEADGSDTNTKNKAGIDDQSNPGRPNGHGRLNVRTLALPYA